MRTYLLAALSLSLFGTVMTAQAAKKDTVLISFSGQHLDVIATPDPVPTDEPGYSYGDHITWQAEKGCHPIVTIDDDGVPEKFKKPDCQPGSARCELDIPKKQFTGLATYKYTIVLQCTDNRTGTADPEVVVAGEGSVNGKPAHGPRSTWIDVKDGNVTPSPASISNGSTVHWRIAKGQQVQFLDKTRSKRDLPASPVCKNDMCEMKIENLVVGRYYPYVIGHGATEVARGVLVVVADPSHRKLVHH